MRVLKNEQGSTSVLIIILMIVLMAFGVAALTTAHAGLRLTERNSVFVQDDYALEVAAVQVKYDLLTLMDENREMALYLRDGSIEDFYVELYEATIDSIMEYAVEHEGFQMVGYEWDIFVSELTGGTRIGTFHYQIASEEKEDKFYIVELDIHLPDYEGELSASEILVPARWQLVVGSVGEVNEDIFFEDPFEDPFSEDENPLGDDDNPFGEEDESFEEDNDPFD